MNTMQERVFDLLNETSTNWTTEMLPMGVITQSGAIDTGWKAHIRKSDNRVFGAFKSYQPMQNHELAELVIRAAEKVGLETAKGGTLKDDALVYYQVILPEAKVNEHKIKRNITALNSHDGSTSVGLGFSNTVVICQNTFYQAMGEVSKVKHTTKMIERVDVLAKRIEKALTIEEQVMRNYNSMAEVQATEDMILSVVNKLFPLKKGKDESTRRKNDVQKLLNSVKREILEKGATAWGIFNGVTYYTNHVAQKEKSLDYLMAGTGARRNGIAYEDMMAWVEARTHETVTL
jgi:hypothetical protein